jgi:hypothetical protein
MAAWVGRMDTKDFRFHFFSNHLKIFNFSRSNFQFLCMELGTMRFSFDLHIALKFWSFILLLRTATPKDLFY